MANKHLELEGRDQVLRAELREAIKLRNAAEARLIEVKAKVARAQSLLEKEEAALASLEASARDFSDRCQKDNAFKILAAIETGAELPDVSGVTTVAGNDTAIVNARLRVMAFKTANADLAVKSGTAEDQASRAAVAVTELAQAVFHLTLEQRIADSAIAAQQEAWSLLDCVRAGCLTAGAGTTSELQQRTFRALDRFASVADKNGPMDEAVWRNWQIQQTASHEPRWRDFIKRLSADASAQFERNNP